MFHKGLNIPDIHLRTMFQLCRNHSTELQCKSIHWCQQSLDGDIALEADLVVICNKLSSLNIIYVKTIVLFVNLIQNMNEKPG